jgi:pimeloyl-ACP methyl ester carboxylesterase
MWDGVEGFAPTLYALGDSLEAWAAQVLELAPPGPLFVVGCSVGGSCALEVVRAAPERVVGLALVGTKAAHRPEPALRDEAVGLLRGDEGFEVAWQRYWRPLFGPTTDAAVVSAVRERASSQPVDDVVRGVLAFHRRSDRTDVLTGWDGPMAFIEGEHDRPDRAAAQAASARHGSVHVIAGAGHYVPLEQPAAFVAALERAIKAADA